MVLMYAQCELSDEAWAQFETFMVFLDGVDLGLHRVSVSERVYPWLEAFLAPHGLRRSEVVCYLRGYELNDDFTFRQCIWRGAIGRLTLERK